MHKKQTWILNNLDTFSFYFVPFRSCQCIEFVGFCTRLRYWATLIRLACAEYPLTRWSRVSSYLIYECIVSLHYLFRAGLNMAYCNIDRMSWSTSQHRTFPSASQHNTCENNDASHLIRMWWVFSKLCIQCLNKQNAIRHTIFIMSISCGVCI